MKIAVFSSRTFEIPLLKQANDNKSSQFELVFITEALNEKTTSLAASCQAVCVFSNDHLNATVLQNLQKLGVELICYRAAGYNTIDLVEAKRLKFKVCRVPAYSPYAIAEHAVALILALNRKLIEANQRVNQNDFSLDGLTGFDLNGKTVGVIGTGHIGEKFANIMVGFGCKVLAVDLEENEVLKGKVNYVTQEQLLKESDVISLHVPLNEHTKYLINDAEINLMKKGVMLINTSRGGLLNTKAAIKGLASGKIAYLGLDVYENESGLFFQKHESVNDPLLKELLTFENVLLTGHQAFLTANALTNIADTTIENATNFLNENWTENFVLN